MDARAGAEQEGATALPAAIKVLRDTIVKQASFDYTAMPETVILFGLGKSSVQQVYYKRLDFIAGVLLKEKQLRVAVTGHSDKSGSPEINRALSLKRAQNISNYLLSKGVAAQQIDTNAVSYLEPAVEGKSNNANIQNRRVVIKFL
jgi:peptidoglycan-associated lipoprotein